MYSHSKGNIYWLTYLNSSGFFWLSIGINTFFLWGTATFLYIQKDPRTLFIRLWGENDHEKKPHWKRNEILFTGRFHNKSCPIHRLSFWSIASEAASPREKRKALPVGEKWLSGTRFQFSQHRTWFTSPQLGLGRRLRPPWGPRRAWSVYGLPARVLMWERVLRYQFSMKIFH